MHAVERLRRDHGILRAKLDVLEAALRMGSETWYVLREVCFTLARQLRDHIRREETLVAKCRKAMNPKVLAEVSFEHKDEPQFLRTLNRLFMNRSSRSFEQIGPPLTQLITGLRRHMDEEERELFPLLEHALAEQEVTAVCAPVPTQRFEEAMTVNRAVQEYPVTRAVFDRLFISLPLEGYCCLDEVAWRHGLEFENLQQALEACTCAAAGREGALSGPASATESSRPD